MTSSSLAALLGALTLAALSAPACSGGSTVVDEAEAPSATAEAAPSAPATSPPAPPTTESSAPPPAPPASTAAAGTKAAGASCDAAAECASGVCEGEGCGAGQGTCAPKDRKCTMDLRQYCGCDGKTFNGGGNCPKARFSKRGPCDGDPGPGPKIPLPPKKP